MTTRYKIYIYINLILCAVGKLTLFGFTDRQVDNVERLRCIWFSYFLYTKFHET